MSAASSRRHGLVAFIALISAAVAACTFGAVTVTTASGPVAGDSAEGVLVFKGIPYAAPPIGPLRWRPPQPAPSWSAPLDATRYGASCLQPRGPDRAGNAGSTDESCLFLNIWTKGLDGKRPVMVWIHGGAFRIGSAALPIYEGTRFAQRGVVLVTLNYRLGRFGFFSHPALAAANPDDARGNYGLMDQAAALAWVRTNIAAFGGDPDNVTVFGESAGGSSVLHLLTAPPAAGLFQKAIIESGGGQQIDRRLDAARGPREALTDQGLGWARSLGIGADANALRGVSAEQVLGDGQLSGGLGAVGPVIDGIWVPDDPGVRLARGEFNNVPLIIGTNSYEASVLGSFGSDASKLIGAIGDQAALRKLYADVADDDTQLANQVFGDATFVAGARHVARSLAAHDTPVYLYHFDYVLEQRRDKAPGAPHGAEIVYVFDAFHQLPPLVQRIVAKSDEAMAMKMNRYWINFATTGDPNGGSLPHWPRYSAGSDELLLFRPRIEVVAKFRAPQLDFFQQLWEREEAR